MKLFNSGYCSIKDFSQYTTEGLIIFKRSIQTKIELLKARRLDKMLARAFTLLQQSQTIHKPRGRRSTCNFETISCEFKSDKRINYADVIEKLITVLKERFDHCPDSALQVRWEKRILKILSIIN